MADSNSTRSAATDAKQAKVLEQLSSVMDQVLAVLKTQQQQSAHGGSSPLDTKRVADHLQAIAQMTNPLAMGARAAQIPFASYKAMGMSASQILQASGISPQDAVRLNNYRLANYDGRQLSIPAGAVRLLQQQGNAYKKAQRLAVFGNSRSLDPEERQQFYESSQQLAAERAYYTNPPPSFSQALGRTVFSSRSINMLGSLAEGNVLPALQTGGALAIRGIRATGGALNTAMERYRASMAQSGSGATVGDGQTTAPGNPDPTSDPNFKAVDGPITDLMGKAGRFIAEKFPVLGVVGGLIAGTAGVVAGSSLLAQAQNANAANYRNGLQNSVGGLGGLGRPSAQNAWDVTMGIGQRYLYDPNTAYNTARVLGENGVTGLHGPNGLAGALQTTMNFSRQFNMDPTQLAQTTGNLMQNGDTSASTVDKMFQIIADGAKQGIVPVAKLVDSLKSLSQASNGSTISLAATASLVKDQNAVGMGMNIGQATAGLASATGANAIQAAALLTGGDMNRYMAAQAKGPGALLNLVEHRVKSLHFGSSAMGEQFALMAAGQSGLDLSGASVQSQLKLAQLIQSGYNFEANPKTLEKLLGTSASGAAGAKLADALVNPKDKAMLAFEYGVDHLANHGFPDLSKAISDAGNWVKQFGSDMQQMAQAAAANIGKIFTDPRLGVNGGSAHPNYNQSPGNQAAGDYYGLSVGTKKSGTVHVQGSLVEDMLFAGTHFKWANGQAIGYATLAGQAMDESTMGTNGLANGGLGQFTKPARDAYYALGNSPYNDKNFFSFLGEPNKYYHKKLDYNNLDQGLWAMAWWDQRSGSLAAYNGGGDPNYVQHVQALAATVQVTVQDPAGLPIPHKHTVQVVKKAKGHRTNGPNNLPPGVNMRT